MTSASDAPGTPSRGVAVFAGAAQFVAVPLVAHGINDESFAVAVARRDPPDPWCFVGSVLAIAGSFLAGVPVGTRLGGLVADPARWGLDFAFPAVFPALGAAQLRRRADWLVAPASGVLAVVIALVTDLTRAPLLLALARRPPRPRLRLWLRLVPLAVLPALAVPLVLVEEGRLVLSIAHPPLWGAVTVLALAAGRVNCS